MKKAIIIVLLLWSLVPAGFSQACFPSTIISMPFVRDGAGQFCFETPCIGTPINSWNLTRLTINGVDFTNRWADASAMPAPIDGRYYIEYDSAYPWGHFEALGACTGSITPEPTPTIEPTPDPTETPLAGQYGIDVSADSFWGRDIFVTYSGDFVGAYNAPLTIGPYAFPFTVTLTAPPYGRAGGIFMYWIIDGVIQPTYQPSVTVTANSAGVPVTAMAQYMEAMVTSAPSPNPTQTPPIVSDPFINITQPICDYVYPDNSRTIRIVATETDWQVGPQGMPSWVSFSQTAGTIGTTDIVVAIDWSQFLSITDVRHCIITLVSTVDSAISATLEIEASRNPFSGPAPVLNTFAPISGSVGTVLTLIGSGFALSDNVVVIAQKTGSPVLQAEIVADSPDGKSIAVTIPATFCPACRNDYPPCAAPCLSGPLPGDYNVFVRIGIYESNQLLFIIGNAVTPEPVTPDPGTPIPTPYITPVPEITVAPETPVPTATPALTPRPTYAPRTTLAPTSAPI